MRRAVRLLRRSELNRWRGWRYGPLLAVVVVGGLWAAGSASAASAPPAVTPSYLFSIPTASGSLTGRNDQHLTLRLTRTRDYLTRFTDRPLRQATVVANVDFARRFASYFADSPPNAVLTYTPRGARIPVSIVLTITAPHWSPKHSTWTFQATRIRKTSDTLPGSTNHIKPPPIPNPHTFTNATLLIDGGSTSVSNPVELPGGGIAASLGGFLQQLFATTIKGAAGMTVSMGLGVDYSYALTAPSGTAKSTVLEPVLQIADVAFAPAIDLRVPPGQLLCTIESSIVAWQNASEPSAVDGAYIFNLTLRGSGQPLYAGTLHYTIPASGPLSAACPD